jgi:hypothetical protein
MGLYVRQTCLRNLLDTVHDLLNVARALDHRQFAWRAKFVPVRLQAQQGPAFTRRDRAAKIPQFVATGVLDTLDGRRNAVPHL